MNVAVKINLTRLTQKEILATTTNGLIDPPKYNLRERIKKEEVPNKKKNKKTEANLQICTLDRMPAVRLWEILKKENKIKVRKDLCCLAKMRTFSPWPAMVVQPDAKMTEVYFFGDGSTGKVPTNEIVPFENCLDIVKKYFKIHGYIRAVREMELMMNIPWNSSITKDF